MPPAGCRNCSSRMALIKIRLTDVAGVTQLVADNVQVIGPSRGGGGGGTVDRDDDLSRPAILKRAMARARIPAGSGATA